MEFNSTERFSDRVDNYVKFRPTYPESLLAFLKETGDLQQDTPVADIGAGTGILTELLLKEGYTVYAVEPNSNMRAAAEAALGSYPNFSSVNGTGEATGLPDQSVSLITIAQAFHWMDPVATRKECDRILLPGGNIAIIWNLRTLETSFELGYEEIKRTYGKDYEKIRKAHEPELSDFFAPDPMSVHYFKHSQYMTLDALKGQLLSSSYMPNTGQEGFNEMMEAVTSLFHAWQENGQVKITYQTKLYINK